MSVKRGTILQEEEFQSLLNETIILLDNVILEISPGSTID